MEEQVMELTSDTSDLNEFLKCEIEIKNEPMELQEDSYCQVELQPINFVDVKPIINEFIHESKSLDFLGKKRGRTRKMSPATRIRLKRAMETEEQRSERLRKGRERVARKRAAERQIVELYQAQLKKQRERVARKRAAERQIVELYQEQLKKQREKVAQKRSMMSPEKRLEMLKKNREYQRLKRLKEKLFGNMIVSVRPNIHQLRHINTSEPFKCDLCSTQHVSQIDLLEHCKSVHSTPNLKLICNMCHELFNDRMSLRNHIKSHSVEIKDPAYHEKRKFLCEICGKIISSFQNFQNHHRIHTGEKPFICKNCGKSFTASVGLHFHSRVHTGQKPYRCEHCEKTFSQRSSYTVHLRLHNNVKPFPCKVCGKCYVTSSLLKVHFQKTHENI